MCVKYLAESQKIKFSSISLASKPGLKNKIKKKKKFYKKYKHLCKERETNSLKTRVTIYFYTCIYIHMHAVVHRLVFCRHNKCKRSKNIIFVILALTTITHHMKEKKTSETRCFIRQLQLQPLKIAQVK